MGRGKSWDFEPEPNEMAVRVAARARARQADMHTVLSDDETYARQHEALRRAAELLAECVDDFLDRAHQAAARERMVEDIDIHALFVDERRFHRDRVAKILLHEALTKMSKDNGEEQDG